MRTYGRITNQDGTKTWSTVVTDNNGFNDAVYATTLIQCLKLNLGESPFNANFGIPAQQSVQQQLYPDLYVWQIQQYFAQFFANVTIQKVLNSGQPYYNINILTHSGAAMSQKVPV